MITQKTNAVLCFAFVASLAIVGGLSHTQTNRSHGLADILNGALQSRYEEGFKNANPLEDVAVSTWATLKYALFGQASVGALIGQDGWIFTSEEYEAGETFNQNIIASVHQIALVSHQLRAKGVQLVPVIVPDKADIYSEKLEAARPQLVKDRKLRLIAGLRGFGVPALDATEVLQAGKANAEMYMRDDTHWSPAGSQAVAEMVAHSMQDIDYSRVEVSTVAKEITKFDGDLLSFVPTKAYRKFFGPTQHSIQTYETTVQNSGGLFDAPAVDVLLVGTSFSAKSEFHFEGFLKQALQADLLNFSTEGQGPFAPMDAFLASETFETNPPKIVIWEIPARYTSKDISK